MQAWRMVDRRPTVALGAEAGEDVLMVVSTAAIWRAAAAAAVESLPAA
jgi:hypothetical protein